jgi:pantothenate kinase-related protein Tda10
VRERFFTGKAMTTISSSDKQGFAPHAASTDQSEARHKSEAITRLLAQKSISNAELGRLAALSSSDPLEAALLKQSRGTLEESLAQRFHLFKAASQTVQLLMEQFGWKISTLDLWSFYLPLAQLLNHWDYDGACNLVGLAGAPGAGKTSIVKILTPLTTILSGRETINVSLDDFYLSPAERQALGHRWRAAPGTHDLVLLAEFISQVKSGRQMIAVPQYDTAAERRDAPYVMSEAPRLVLFEGWFVGAPVPGYESLSRALDHLIYLDMDIDVAFASRVEREAKIRAESGDQKGLTAEQTESFWRDVLLPGTEKWVAPLKDQAELVFKIDATRRIHFVRSA